MASPSPNRVDVVVVTYNSRDLIRGCVENLAGLEGIEVFVVDNDSNDGTLGAISDLPLTTIAQPENRGFASGCNVGWRRGRAPFVLLLNPDATIDSASLRHLESVLERDPEAGIVAPRITDSGGALAFSQRRFPRLRSTFAQALVLHRLFPTAAWSNDVVRDELIYERPGSPEWVVGACILVRRQVLEAVQGLDEGFFLYREDADLCRRVRDAGAEVRFEPHAACIHTGGASAPRATLLPVLAQSRIRYARKHSGRTIALVERIGVALGAAVHIVVSRGGLAVRKGHARSLRVAISRPVWSDR